MSDFKFTVIGVMDETTSFNVCLKMHKALISKYFL